MKKYIKLLIIPLILVLVTGCKIKINVKDNNHVNNSSILAVGDPYKIEIYPKGSESDIVTITNEKSVDEIYSYFRLDNLTINKNNNVKDYKLLYKLVFYGSNARETVNVVEDDKNETFFIHGKVKVRFNRKYVDAIDNFVSNEIDINNNNNNNNNKFILKNIDLDDIFVVSVDPLGQYTTAARYIDDESIEKLYEIFSNKYSDTPSTEENPVEPDVLYVVKFKDYLNKEKMFYIYSKKDKYYIEDSGYAIFESNEKEFKIVEEMAKKNQ